MPKSFLRRNVLIAALLALVALVAGACSSGSSEPSATVTKTGAAPAADGSSAPSSSTSPPPPPKTRVRITTINSDNATYGVGMPVLAYFSKKITNAKQWQADTKVTVNGKPITTAWYFQPSSAGKGPLEAQLRPQEYWPAHSRVHVQFPKAGTSLGGDFVSAGGLSTLDFRVGPRNIVTVDDGSNRVNVVSDGKQWGSFPTSLGAPDTRTKRGIKVIMEQTPSTCMRDTAGSYYECGVKWDSRLTFDGEYLHSAPWNISNINAGINSSNGCTNMLPDDAERVFHFLRVGDPVVYPNADGPMMTMGAGYGLWNVQWSEYQTGGAVPTQ